MISFCWCWNHHKMLAVKSLMSGKSKDLSLLIMLLLKCLLLLTQKLIKVRVFKCKTFPWLEEWALIINSLKVNLLTISQTDRPELSTLKDIILETWNPIWKMEKVYYPQRSELMSEIGWMTKNQVTESLPMLTKQFKMVTGITILFGKQRIGLT